MCISIESLARSEDDLRSFDRGQRINSVSNRLSSCIFIDKFAVKTTISFTNLSHACFQTINIQMAVGVSTY